MTRLDDWAKRYWSASYFLRRGLDRDKSVALAILENLTETATGLIQTRAAQTLKEYHVE